MKIGEKEDDHHSETEELLIGIAIGSCALEQKNASP